MSYADLLNQTQHQCKVSSDRLISGRCHRRRSSLTSPVMARAKKGNQLAESGIPFTPSVRTTKHLLQIQTKSPVRVTESSSSSPVTNRIYRVFGRPFTRIELDNVHSDFYISPIDWSKTDIIALACTDSTVFINPKTTSVTVPPQTLDMPTSLRFSEDGSSLVIGSGDGHTMLYSPHQQQAITKLRLFDTSVLCYDWHANMIIAGGYDGEIGTLDPRECKPIVVKDDNTEKTCCVKFNSDGNKFATSGSDARVNIWDIRNLKKAYMTYSEHSATVRAIQWSPTCDKLILTGGGSYDRMIRMWNVDTGQTFNFIDTGSQVCNLYWHSRSHEILSTHGYSQNHLALWKATDLTPIEQFFVHKERVLFMAVSGDESRVATVAPGEGIFIWKMFKTSLDQIAIAIR